ncbi:hypothetical protein D3C71_1588690 [compost metagenome]
MQRQLQKWRPTRWTAGLRTTSSLTCRQTPSRMGQSPMRTSRMYWKACSRIALSSAKRNGSNGESIPTICRMER